MDDTFSYEMSGRLPRRRIDPFALKLAVAAFVVVLGIGLFARWVIASERVSVAATPEAEGAFVRLMPGASAPEPAVIEAAPDDLAAQRDLTLLLGAARQVLRRQGSLAAAGPGLLGLDGVTIVDGASPAAGIVSVATSEDAWSAATMSQTGTCFWISLTPGEGVAYGDGADCTGAAAASAASAGW